jgi:hypothetical protein
MLKYGMNDLRAFFDGDARWLSHYGFSALDVPTLSGGVGVSKKGGYNEILSLVAEGPARHRCDRPADCRWLNAVGLEVEGVEDPARS